MLSKINIGDRANKMTSKIGERMEIRILVFNLIKLMLKILSFDKSEKVSIAMNA